MAAQDSLQSLLDRAAARHAGWDRWRRLGSITLHLEALAGMVPRLMGLGRSHPPMTRVRVEPRRRRLIAFDYPEAGAELVFDRGRVAQVSAGQEPRFDHEDYRPRLLGRAPWSRFGPEDAIYFFGYALTHYLALPFSLAEAQVVEYRHRSGRVLPDRVRVHYPSGSHTHGEHESFHFDASGLLVRHDYRAEVLGGLAYGAHFSRDYVEVDGFMIACRREVFMRVGGWATPVPVLRAKLRPLEVSYVDDPIDTDGGG